MVASMRPLVRRVRAIVYTFRIRYSGLKVMKGLGGRSQRKKTTKQHQKYDAESQMFVSHYFTPHRCNLSSAAISIASLSVYPSSSSCRTRPGITPLNS